VNDKVESMSEENLVVCFKGPFTICWAWGKYRKISGQVYWSEREAFCLCWECPAPHCDILSIGWWTFRFYHFWRS